MRIGVLLCFADLAKLLNRNVNVLVIIPGSDFDELDVKSKTELPCINLNDYISKGEISSLSRVTANFIRSFMKDIEGPIEALSSQNDLYQYHLRSQYLFLVALERYLNTLTSYTIVFETKKYFSYVSPMRPDLGLLYSPNRTLAFLASELIEKKAGKVEFIQSRLPRLFQFSTDNIMLFFRKKITSFFIIYKLFQKIFSSMLKRYRIDKFLFKDWNDKSSKIGIIVRTDSEVISASYLINDYIASGQKYIVIQDEILSSTTTVSRLEQMNICYVPIGCIGGFSALVLSLFQSANFINCTSHNHSKQNYETTAENILFQDNNVVKELKKRLFDFFVPQRHFARELSAMVEKFNITKLVTFAYVDQWGGVVKSVGDNFGIKTISIQNAAQDPEEYPRLCWADHYCVESLYLKRRLVGLGYPETKISGTGLPHYTASSLSDTIKVNKCEVNQIVILTQPIYDRYYNQLIEAASNFCAQNDYVLAVKYHPRQAGNEYTTAIESALKKCMVKVYKSESLDKIVLSSKLAISVVSAAILRSLNLGVPTVSFLPKSEKYLDLYYTDSDNLFVVSDISGFNKLLRNVKDNYSDVLLQFEKKLEHYVAEHCIFENHQNPLRNVIRVIDSI